MFFTVFLMYCVLAVAFKGFSNIGAKQIFEIVFVGLGVGLFCSLMMNPTRRAIENILRNNIGYKQEK
jgi:hypothetical protein